MSASRLADELSATNQLLRGMLPPKPRPLPEGYRSDLMPLAGFAFAATFRALRNELMNLPEKYWDRDLIDDTVTIVCKCRRGSRLANYTLHECGCGRLYCVTHRSVKVLPLDA